MKKLFLFFLCLSFSGFLFAQTPRFFNEVQQLRQTDSINGPIQSPSILFIGSSSFTKWKDVQDYFPATPIINHGFGGSTLPDLIRYVDDIVPTKNIKQIVIYCGDNDLASGDSITAEIVEQRFQKLFGMLRKKIKNVPILYVSIKPSPSRERLMPEMVKTNLAIQHFLQTKKKTAFADVYHPMLDDNGKPIKDIFIEDNLHMNAKGYAIWQKVMQSYLLK